MNNKDEPKNCHNCKYAYFNWRYCYCNYQKCEITVPGWGCIYHEMKEEKNDAERDMGM